MEPNQASNSGQMPSKEQKENTIHAGTVPGSSVDVENKAGTTPIDVTSEKKTSAFKALGWLDRFLAIWILLAMVIGVLLGNFVDDVGLALQKGHFVGVSVPIAVGLLVMMYPILCKVRYESLHELFSHKALWRQIGFSVFVNWIVAPFFMVGSAVDLQNISWPRC